MFNLYSTIYILASMWLVVLIITDYKMFMYTCNLCAGFADKLLLRKDAVPTVQPSKEKILHLQQKQRGIARDSNNFYGRYN